MTAAAVSALPAAVALAKDRRPFRSAAQIFLYVSSCVALATLLPIDIWAKQQSVFLIFGAFGLWRYSWWFTHLVRAKYYGRVTYPRMAAKATAAWNTGWRPRRLHFLLTLYHERIETTEVVVAAICGEIRALGLPATIWLGSKEAADEAGFARCLEWYGSDLDIHLRIVRQTGSGKRNAIALILAAMARDGLSDSDFVAFMDSDFVLTPGAMRKCLPLFAVDPELQALTTDEDCIVHGPRWIQTWLDMRFAQRRMGMQSHAQSKRVLTLTGRFSMFRGTHIVTPEFVSLVERDMLDHWLWGEFRFLSGDDKSTWYALLKVGAGMTYVPDAHGVTIEYIEGSGMERMTQNLLRWSGNMLRNGSRAIALGPSRMPFFIWWCLIDQRIAMWTTMFGPLCALIGTVKFGPSFLLAYFIYVALTRLVVAMVLSTFHRRFDIGFAWALYTSQLLNSVVKLFMIWRLPRQRWANRGNQSAGASGGKLLAQGRAVMASYLTGLSVAFLLLVALVATGALTPPDIPFLRAIYGDLRGNVR